MAVFDPATLDRWRALAIVDRDGTTVGTISEFYLDRETGYPTWALVNTGLFGATQTLVPLVHATEIGDGLQVPYEKSHIRDTPRLDLHDELSPGEEAALFAHYGVDYQPAATPVPPGEGPPGAGPGTAEGPETMPGESGTAEGPETVPAEPGTAGSDDTQAGAAPDGAAVPDEPGPPEAADDPYGTGSLEAASAIPDEPGTTDPGDATLVAPGGFGSGPEHHDGPAGPDEGPVDSAPRSALNDSDPPRAASPDPDAGAADPDLSGSAPADPDADPSRGSPSDPGLSRTAPVEPGLPGSTAASLGPVPETVDKDTGGDPGGQPAKEALQAPDEPGWAPGAAESFDEPVPVDPPAGASDRWREAKLAAERDRIARSAAAQPEERSPLERARRRLERLVGGGQDHADPDDIAPADRDAAERARRARLGLDEDDPRMR